MRLSLVMILTVFGYVARGAIELRGVDIGKLRRTINDEEELNSYMRCLTGDEECSEEKQRVKDMLLDVMKSDPTKCNPREQCIVREMFRYLRRIRPDEFDRFFHANDPTKIHQKKLEPFLESTACGKSQKN